MALVGRAGGDVRTITGTIVAMDRGYVDYTCRMNLFTNRDLWAWLDQPYTAPPPIDAPQQEVLALD